MMFDNVCFKVEVALLPLAIALAKMTSVWSNTHEWAIDFYSELVFGGFLQCYFLTNWISNNFLLSHVNF